MVIIAWACYFFAVVVHKKLEVGCDRLDQDKRKENEDPLPQRNQVKQTAYGLCEYGEGRMPERPQDRLRASKPSFPSQESETDEDCQDRGRETRSEVSARSKA